MNKLLVILFVALMVTKSLSLNAKLKAKEEVNAETSTLAGEQGQDQSTTASSATSQDGITTPSLLQKLKCLTNCPKTAKKRQVCGTDGITYPSIGFLECVKSCGVKVDVQSMEPCTDAPPSTLL